MNRLKESNIFSGGEIIPLNNRRTLLKSYIWNYVVSNSGKATLENSIKGDIDLELIGGTEQLTTTGKNIFDESKAVTGRINPDNGELLPETSYISSDYIEVQEGETYFQSGSGDGYYRAFYDMNKKFTSIPTKGVFKITVPVGSKFLRISGRKERFGDWMIEKGDKATDYEPYTGLKPSPSPEYQQEIKSAGKWDKEKQKYEIDVKVTGKNLFDREKARDITNWIVRDGDGYGRFPIRVGKGNKVTFSYTEKLTAGKGFYLGIAQSDTGSAVGWLYHSTEINLNSNKFTVVAQGDCLYLSCNKSSIQKFFDTIQTLQVEMESKQTPYEPYTEQTLTLTSDRPITKWDKLEKRNSVYGILYGSKHVVLNGSEEDWAKSSIDNIFYLKSFEGLPNSYEIFCDKLKNFRGAVNVIELNCILANRTNLYICIDGITDIGTLKTWLSENNLEVYYNSKELEFVPLPQETQLALQSLHSHNGTTHINIDSGEVECGIKVAYKQKK